MKALAKQLITRILEIEARLVLKKYRPRIVAVTGSVGKTSTKDAIYTVLASHYYVRRSEKSFNSEIGVPLTVLGVPNAWNNPLHWLRNIVDGLLLIVLPSSYPEWLVLEVGADRPGDIARITQWVKPDVAVVTRIPDIPVHVEFFDSPEQVAEEKGNLVTALKEDGTLVFNGDDERVMALSKKVQKTPLTYGFGQGNHFIASEERIQFESDVPTGYTFRVDHRGKSVPIEIRGAIGRQHVFPALAAVAVGANEGMNMVDIGQALAGYEPPAGRMRLLAGIKDTTIIDDSYNSSPVAAHEALEMLAQCETGGKRIAVLGDMLELGQYTAHEHTVLGERAAEVCDYIVTVGPRARNVAEGALGMGFPPQQVFQYEDAQRAGKELEHTLEPNDVVLIKGSQGVRCERAVHELMRYPQHAPQLLVRQGDAWKHR
jgi:UDP-N-acetylmuramoyl-tripeptide--D-alanyl-D-alanine ligase